MKARAHSRAASRSLWHGRCKRKRRVATADMGGAPGGRSCPQCLKIPKGWLVQFSRVASGADDTGKEYQKKIAINTITNTITITMAQAIVLCPPVPTGYTSLSMNLFSLFTTG